MKNSEAAASAAPAGQLPTPPAYDFAGLSPEQRALLTVGGWAADSAQRSEPPNATTRELLARGLLVLQRRVEHDGRLTRRFEVPDDVAAAWAACRAAELAADPSVSGVDIDAGGESVPRPALSCQPPVDN